MNKQEAEKLADPVVKEIVNCISEKRYADIEKCFLLKVLLEIT